jgi:hypothetical protein
MNWTHSPLLSLCCIVVPNATQVFAGLGFANDFTVWSDPRETFTVSTS